MAPPKILLTLQLSVKCQIISGSDWDAKRQSETLKRRQRLMALAGLQDLDNAKKSTTNDDIITDLLKQRKTREQKTDSEHRVGADQDRNQVRFSFHV
jgi:hypothetical protein